MSQKKKGSERLSFAEWTEAYLQRSHAEENAPHGWCVGSLQFHPSSETICPHCQQDTSAFRRKGGLAKDQLTLHTRVNIPKGLYLIHVGAINNEGDWFKIGSSQVMTERLWDHLRKPSHEYCRVLYQKGHSKNWKTVEGVEGLINGRLRAEFTVWKDEEYFPFSEEAVTRCKQLMDDPSLLLPDLYDTAA